MSVKLQHGLPADGSAPTPGVYVGISALQYHGLPLCSNSALGVIHEKTPLHLWHQRNNPKPETDALRIGRAWHTLALEPHLFADAHPIATQCAASTGKGDPCVNPGKYQAPGGDWFCGTHAKTGKAITPGYFQPEGMLTIEESQDLFQMFDAIRAHPKAGKLVTGKHQLNEVTIIWDRDVLLPGGIPYKLRCKMRGDMIRPEIGVAGDLKTTEDASPEEFAKSIFDYGYHRQAAFYQDGISRYFEGIDKFCHIVSEKAAPNAVALYELDPVALQAGRNELETLCHRYAACEASGKWPGYSDDFQPISLPAWRIKQLGL